MFKTGSYYLTVKGLLVKILNEFTFKDGATINAAVYLPAGGGGWYSYRYKPDGTCITDANLNMKSTETHENYLTYMKLAIGFDHATRTWAGTATDMMGNLISQLTAIESQERALKLLSMGAQEKLLTIMRESGYVDEMDEEAT